MTPLAQTFYFDAFEYNSQGEIVFNYSTDAGHQFVHTLTHSFPRDVDLDALTPALFALGMAELPHYWKAILAPRIIVKAGALDSNQVSFWQNLYTKGLGEFFYKNSIDFRNLFSIESASGAPVITPKETSGDGILVPIGGGKDSLVTAELLKKEGKMFSWFELEPIPFFKKLESLSQVTEHVSIGRNVLSNFAPIIKLVEDGAPNGHVPITATYTLSAALAASAYGFQDVVLSLERSASFGNVTYLNQEINHQYSKSFEFEKQVSDYIKRYINPHMRVFSLVRPLYEIQIIKLFSKYPQYFADFLSCNPGLKKGQWCGVCAKCAFMFAALSAFLEQEEVRGIFGKNLFEDVSLIPLYKELAGDKKFKPFDCVGTIEENKLALYLASKKYETLPLVLAALDLDAGAAYQHLLTDTTDAHRIPEGYSVPKIV